MRVVDLSQEIHPEIQVFSPYPHPTSILWTRREIFGFEAESIFMATHTGTHIDAPYHFDPAGIKIHQLALDGLLGWGVLLDLTKKGAKAKITRNDIEAAERSGEQIRSKDVVIVKTGWEQFIGKAEYLTSYPGLTKDAAQYLVSKNVTAVGVDSPNPDHPEDNTFPFHNTLLPRGVLIIENLANLDELRKNRFRFVGLPLKIRDATGSPIRAVAIEE